MVIPGTPPGDKTTPCPRFRVVILTHRWTPRLTDEFGHRGDLTPELEKMLSGSGIETGVLTVQLMGSTGLQGLALSAADPISKNRSFFLSILGPEGFR